MKTPTLVTAGLASLTLALAAPAAAAPPQGQALYPETIPGAGLAGVAGAQATLNHVLIGRGSVGTARFRIDVGRASTVVYVDPVANLRFRALHVNAVRFVGNSARLRGVGLLNERRVGFAVFAAHNAKAGVDVFRIAWLHGASRGGRVAGGSVFIR